MNKANFKIFFAPLEGITDTIFRNTFDRYYGGVDKYFTPFLSPNETRKFTSREWNHIDPEKNEVSKTVPQLLTKNADHFLWACQQIVPLGYGEINLNLGCPSGTVVAKKKGSGLLYYPEELEAFLYAIFDGREKSGLQYDISIKTRLGKNDPEEFYEILDIYNKFPISQLTIHPRVQADFYKTPIREEYFAYAVGHTAIPLIYNGELKLVDNIDSCLDSYPQIDTLMIGRGLLMDPELALKSKGLIEKDVSFDYDRFWSFHDDLLRQYREILSGDTPLLHRIKEFWVYWEQLFPGKDKEIKKLRKSKRLEEYQGQAQMMRG